MTPEEEESFEAFRQRILACAAELEKQYRLG